MSSFQAACRHAENNPEDVLYSITDLNYKGRRVGAFVSRLAASEVENELSLWIDSESGFFYSDEVGEEFAEVRKVLGKYKAIGDNDTAKDAEARDYRILTQPYPFGYRMEVVVSVLEDGMSLEEARSKGPDRYRNPHVFSSEGILVQ